LNLVVAAPIWLLAVLACAMIAAAIEDAARFRISNLTSLVVLAGAFAAAAIEGPSSALWQNGAVFVVILVLGTAAFSAGVLGGGDVKLFAATGLWFDLRSALSFVVLVFLSGGVVAIGYLLSRLFRGGARGGMKEKRVPYGIAIALGALILVLLHAGAFHHEGALPRAFTVVPHLT
jgi:prepilin peptidase CpaA